MIAAARSFFQEAARGTESGLQAHPPFFCEAGDLRLRGCAFDGASSAQRDSTQRDYAV
jgi:hypothetical protein